MLIAMTCILGLELDHPCIFYYEVLRANVTCEFLSHWQLPCNKIQQFWLAYFLSNDNPCWLLSIRNYTLQSINLSARIVLLFHVIDELVDNHWNQEGCLSLRSLRRKWLPWRIQNPHQKRVLAPVEGLKNVCLLRTIISACGLPEC